MKKLVALVPAVLLVQGCVTADLNKVANDAMTGALGSVLGSNNSGSVIKGGNSYSIGSEKIKPVEIKKSSRDYGKIEIVATRKNPQGQTKLALNNCTHPRIGKLRCGGYIYEVSSEGWLKKEHITFDDLNHPEITIAAGRYYIKAHNWDTGMNRYVTGEFTVKPFVTNVVDLVLE